MSDTMMTAAGCIMSLACFSFCRSFLAVTRLKDYPRAFWFKGGAALCFVALGLLGVCVCPARGFAWTVAAGLVLGLAGDQLLAMRFLKSESFDRFFSAGALVFALGHGLYVLALLRRYPGSLALGLILAALFVAASVVYLRRNGFDAGGLTLCGYVYIAVVCVMGAVAIAAAIQSGEPAALLFALGGVCFIVSDNVLCIYSFGADRRFGLNVLLHITYYAAQLSIGWSLFLAK